MSAERAAIACHVVKFCKPSTSAINALAFDKATGNLAVGRACGVIEVYATETLASLKTFFVVSQPATVEALAWANGSLFSAGMDGFIREFRMDKRLEIHSTKAAVCAIWCLAKNPVENLVAAGAENGTVCLCEVSSESGIVLNRPLQRSQGRVLSLCWSHDGSYLAAGSVDAISVWSVAANAWIHRLALPKETAKSETLIWCLAITTDLVIISGDSAGKTSFWNCSSGTFIQSFQSHRADVLALCLDGDNCVYAAGVDPLIVQFVRVESISQSRSTQKYSNWIEGVKRNPHSHAVRSLVTGNSFLISGGVDACLVLSKYPPNTSYRLLPTMKDCFSFFAPFLLHHYESRLEFWMLGKTPEKPNIALPCQQLTLCSEPVKLLEVRVPKSAHVVCSAMSACGQFIAYSSIVKTYILHVVDSRERHKSNTECPEASFDVRKVSCTNAELTSACLLAFRVVSDRTQLIHYSDLGFQVFEIDDVICKLTHSVRIPDISAVIKMKFSVSGDLLGCVCVDRRVVIVSVDDSKLISSLPVARSFPVDINFTDSSLIVLYDDCTITEWNIRSSAYSTWSREFLNCNFKSKLQRVFKQSPVLGFALSMRRPNKLVVYNSHVFLSLDRSSISHAEESVCVYDKFKNLLYLNFSATDDSFLVVQVDDKTYQAGLPPLLYTKKFGAN